MTNHSTMARRSYRRRTSAAMLAPALAAAALLGAPTAQAKPRQADVPAEVAVPAGHKMFLAAHAVGVQIYSCNAASGTYRWDLVAPRAELYDRKGKRLMTHFAGPTWQAKDGSSVVAARVDGVTVDPTAIPWLLLSASATAPGPYGDRLVKTAYIQRIHTTGGLAPAAGQCNATTAGTTAQIPYTAEYRFWKKR